MWIFLILDSAMSSLASGFLTTRDARDKIFLT